MVKKHYLQFVAAKALMEGMGSNAPLTTVGAFVVVKTQLWQNKEA